MRASKFVWPCVSLFALSATPLAASDPPFPNELLYPNVIPPEFQFGTYGHADGQFSDPRSVCFLNRDAVLISDRGNRRLQVYSVRGKFMKDGLGYLPDLIEPAGLHCARDRIAVADKGASVVRILDTTGRQLATIGEAGMVGAGGLREPEDVWIERGVVAVADTGNNRVQLFSIDGRPLRTLSEAGGIALNGPMSVAMDKSGAIFVADSHNNRIVKFDAEGAFLKSWGKWGSRAGLFATPSALYVAGKRLYVTDLTNHRIQIFDLEGKFVGQWGRHPVDGHEGNGRTHYPYDIAADPKGRRFIIAEPVENRLQVFRKARLKRPKNVDDSAWWDKATRFHYGARPSLGVARLAVSEPDTHSVLIFDVGGGGKPEFIARAGGYGTNLGQMIEPAGVTFNADDSLVVSDAGNLRLQAFDLLRPSTPAAMPLGAMSTRGFLVDRSVTLYGARLRRPPMLAGNLDNPTEIGKEADAVGRLGKDGVNVPSSVQPGAVARHANGDLYVYDQTRAEIVVVRGLEQVRRFGRYGTGTGEFRGIHNLSFSKDGTELFVVDAYNFRIQVFGLDGTFKRQFGQVGVGEGQFLHPFGISSGIDGFVYVSDEPQHMIHKFREDGSFVRSWGRWGTGPGEFYKPKGLTQFPDGRLIVLNFGNHRGDIFTSDGAFIESFGLADPGTQAGERAIRLTLPRAYAADSRSLFGTPAVAKAALGPMIKTSVSGKLDSNDRAITLGIESDSPSLVVGRANNLRIEPPKHCPAADTNLRVSAEMPAHRHGLAVQPKITREGGKYFTVSGLKFTMPGVWDVFFDLACGPVEHRVQQTIIVTPE